VQPKGSLAEAVHGGGADILAELTAWAGKAKHWHVCAAVTQLRDCHTDRGISQGR
jgi:hypothetical protein